MHPLLRGVVLLGPMLTAAIRRADRQIASELRDGQASSPDRAVTFSPRSPIVRWRLHRLIHGGVVHALDADRYYWDESAWPEFRRQRRKRALTIVTALLLVIAVLWWQGIVG